MYILKTLIDNDLIGPSGRAGGVTVFNGNNSSKIFIAPSLKGDYFGAVRITSSGIVHETIHAYHLSKGLTKNYNSYSEAAASTYSYAYLKGYGSRNGASFYLPAIRSYPKEFSYTNLPNIIKTGLEWKK